LKTEAKTPTESSKHEATIKFLAEAKGGKYTEVNKEILNPACARIQIFRQPQQEQFYYFSIS
jgi:hypothetical protein